MGVGVAVGVMVNVGVEVAVACWADTAPSALGAKAAIPKIKAAIMPTHANNHGERRLDDGLGRMGGQVGISG